jgi:type II secretory ATPase GspE/PulE/Tfp pilus assembly ATPase PilB-like protein
MAAPPTADKPAVEAAELPDPAAAAPSAQPRQRLGELLVRANALRSEHLEQALAEQQQSPGRRIGEILVAHGFVSSKTLAQALAYQHGLEFVDLARVEVEPAATSLLPEQFARKAQVLPVRFVAKDLVQVALADPTNLATADDLRLALGLNIQLAVAEASALEGTIDRTYRVHIEIKHEGEAEEASRLHDVRDADGTETASDLANSLLSRAISEGASDIHFDPQERELIVRARIDGVLRRMAEVPKTLEASLIGRLKVMGLLDIAEKRMPQDGSFAIRYGDQPVDVRIAVVPTKHGEHVVLRILHRAVKLELPELGMSPEAERLFMHAIRQPFGAVIACGPTGSGKTTTLYAALDALNEEGRAITTVEDPVEYQLPGVNQMEVHSKIGLPSPAGCARSCAATPTCSWSARSATRRRRRSRSRRP